VKVCSTCKKDQPYKAYSVCNKVKSGFNARCKTCEKLRHKKDYQRFREHNLNRERKVRIDRYESRLEIERKSRAKNKEKNTQGKNERKLIRNKCASPNVKNIFSELYIKAINSFAFNLIALKTEKSNRELLNDKKSIRSIRKIFEEFDKIIISLGLPILQSKSSRINQTLSSTSHTLSMLHDYKRNKKVELSYLWSTLKLLSVLTNKDIKYTKKI
jgi:ketopantoate reductase